ncbi:Permeases of the drug/metabolite transporter (DMT) superfamily [Rivularia sp. IAM M-261]|nr:Permeases of the drug/metabolite transporter (DMT) superfamily [Calothrix sp. PCC 7716]GJD21722.1 Permeases of the drug/metabolite transporter (DMT) superfamily [Rivularia sp. IAM M-261]
MTQLVETIKKDSFGEATLLPISTTLSTKLSKFPAVGLAVLCAACFGVTVPMTKQSLVDLSPLMILVIQGISSIIFLWSVVLYQKVELPKKSVAWSASLIGFLEPGLSYIFATIGLSLTTASNATLISVSEPIITIALAAVLLKEKISSPLIKLALIACVGVGMVASPSITNITGDSLTGDFLVMLGVVCASLYAIVARPLLKKVAPLVLVALQQSFALVWFVLILTILQLMGQNPINLGQFHFESVLLAMISGIVGQGLAFWLYLLALRTSGVSVTSLYLTLIPLFGVATAYVALGERLSLIQTLGGGLILVVVLFISQLPEAKH